MTHYVLVTGSNGGIGSALCAALRFEGYSVIGIDRMGDRNGCEEFIQRDIEELVTGVWPTKELTSIFERISLTGPIIGLVNNAAAQILGGIEDATLEDFQRTINTNLTAPFLLSKLMYPFLKSAGGSIVNVGSVHSRLTKPKFIAYATSKAALLGLTTSMAVDVGGEVRVNAVQPAATATAMLLQGFIGNEKALDSLKSHHPTNSIATPAEIASAICFLLDPRHRFMNGTVLDINGGIGSRLHDPA